MRYAKNIQEFINETLNDEEWLNAGMESGETELQLRSESDLIDVVIDMLSPEEPESTEPAESPEVEPESKKITRAEILFTCDMYMSGMDAQQMKTLALSQVQVPEKEKRIETGDTIFYLQKYNYEFDKETIAPIVICDVVDQGQGYSYVFIKLLDYKKFNDINKIKYGDIEVIPFEPSFENPDRNKFSR